MNPEPATDELAHLAPASRTLPRAIRMRIGVGAGILLLIAALVVAVLVSALSQHGSTRSVSAVTAQTGAQSGARSAGSGSGAGSGGAAAAGNTPTPAVVVFVHVLGAVQHPGLFQLHEGARVIDAVSAAGGFTSDANQGGVNLARILSDGEQLVVPKIGEAPPVAAAPPASGSGAAGGDTAAGGTVNLNTATESDLETLPRIGPALAARILDWRTTNGRFTSVEDLMSVSGIGEKTFDGLKDRVTV